LGVLLKRLNVNDYINNAHDIQIGYVKY